GAGPQAAPGGGGRGDPRRPPPASAPARAGHKGKIKRLAKTPGMVKAASRMATKFRTTPTSATVPRAAAVSGAVAIVAPIEEPSILHQALFPRAWSVQRVTVEAPQSAATDNHPPRSNIDQGSTSRTQRQVAERSALGSTRRCRTRLSAKSTAKAAALVAGAGQPRK